MRVAIVHDWLTVYSGAEFVLEQMLACFPEADIFATVDFLDENRDFLRGAKVTTSFVQKLPLARKRYRQYLPLMPLAVEQFDLSAYDLVISSSHAVAKGVITGPNQLHVCMCYSPIRYAWDLQHQYLAETGLDRGLKGWVAKYLLHRLRIWDVRTANGVDRFIGISKFIQRRIEKAYRRESDLIYPPVDTDFFDVHPDVKREDYYVTASRLVPYKRVDLLIEAFADMPEKKLLVIGDGPEMPKLRQRAQGKGNITLLGRLERHEVRDTLRRANAFIFAAEEDFGIAPVEAQACGTPVIAFGRGGAKETVISGQGDSDTGVFFHEQSAESLQSAIELFESRCEESFDQRVCRSNAERYGVERFRMQFRQVIDQQLKMIA